MTLTNKKLTKACNQQDTGDNNPIHELDVDKNLLIRKSTMKPERREITLDFVSEDDPLLASKGLRKMNTFKNSSIIEKM